MENKGEKDFIDQIIMLWHAVMPDLDVSGTQLTGRLVRINSYISKQVEENLGQYHLNVGEFDVLAALERHPKKSMTPGELQTQIMISSGGLTNRINRLEERDLIVRQAVPGDRRSVIVQLTTLGENLIKEVAPTHLAVEKSFVSALTAQEKKSLEKILRKLLITCEE